MAIVNQGRAANGGASLNSPSNPTQALQGLYSLPATDFNEVTTGYNGLSAGPGYNEVTGLGTPIANLLVPALATYDLGSAQLAVTMQPPASVAAGSTFELWVSVENAAGSVLTNYHGTVTIALLANPGHGTLSGTLTVPVSNGVATFSGLTLDAAGTGYTIVANSSELSSATTSAFAVTAGAAVKLAVLNEPPPSVRAGSTFAFGVAVEDQFNNVVTTYFGSVSILLATDPTGDTLRGTLSAMVTDGIASFSGLTLDLAATGYSIEATSTGLTSNTTDPFAVTASSATQLMLATGPSSTATAGQAFSTQPVIEEVDEHGNLEMSDDSNVVLVVLASGAGPLQGTTSVTLSDGIATFTSLADNKAGTITLSFKSGNLKSVTSSAIVVSASTASEFVIQTEPSSNATAGVAFLTQPVIEEEDRYGNVETSDDSTVVMASLASGTGPLQGDNMATLSGGVATFIGLADDTAETMRLNFESGNLQAARSNAIVVGSGAATKLAIEIQPSATATAGQTFGAQPVILEEDAFGNIETSDYSTDVTVALGSGLGPLQGTNSVNVIGGAAIFGDLADNKAETLTLSFTSGSLTPATSNPIVISPAGASQLVVSTQPSTTAMAGEAFTVQPIVMEEDRYGNVESSDDSAVVTASVAGGPGALDGTATATLSGGVATFTNLADKKAGTLKLSFASGFLAAATSAPILVSPGPATQLVVAAQPSATATAGLAFSSPSVIDEQDEYGNVETGDSSTVVTASLQGGAGVLSGVTTATVSSGVATFTKLYDNTSGTLALQFTGGGLTPAVSAQTVVSARAGEPVGAADSGVVHCDGRAAVCHPAGRL